MPRFRIHLTSHVGHTVEVEAETEDEAIEAALNGDLPVSCHQCPQIEDWDFLPDVDDRQKREHYITEFKEPTA